MAELDNVRKRAQRDIEAANRYGLEKFAAELLPVRDSLELAVHSAGQADVDARSLKQGQQATLQLLAKALERLGVAPINPVGEPFDPGRHEADAGPGIGYREARHGAAGGADRLRAQRQGHPAGARDRRQGVARGVRRPARSGHRIQKTPAGLESAPRTPRKCIDIIPLWKEILAE